MTRYLLVSMIALVSGVSSAVGADAPAMRRAQDAGLRYEIPASWERVPAPSNMRAAQFRVPGPAGNAEAVLFFFGMGQGGTTQANLDRWYAQFTQPDGRPSREAAVVTTRTVNGLTVTAVDLQGTYSPVAMGGGAATPQPDTRMLAAAIEGPGGPWFLRVVGPAATMKTVASDFDRVLRSVQAHQ